MRLPGLLGRAVPPRFGGWRRAVCLALGALAISNCMDQAGPADPVPGHFALAPRFESAAAGLVTVARGRFLLTRLPGGEVALDTVLGFAPDADSVDLAFTVLLNAPGERFQLRIALIGPAPANDTVFRAGPIDLTPATAAAPIPIDAPLVYTGVGANATSVVLTAPAAPILAGVLTPLTAVALDSVGEPIAGTPIAYRSLDTLIAAVPDDSLGEVLGVARGTARIVAALLTGPADTVTVDVVLPPAAIAADSGNGQSGPAGGLLPQSLVARVTASDGVGVPGVLVRYQVTLGGGAVSLDSVLTDASGRARVNWTLGNVVGTQTVRATTPALPGASASFSATSVGTGPGAITITAGNNQSALVSTAVATAPQVRVTNAQSDPVAGAQVTFAVTGGGGALAGAVATTDAGGLAAVGSWTLGANVGLNTITATVSGQTPVQFTALGTSTGGVTSMTLNAGDGQTALGGSVVPIAPSVLLRDTAGTPIAGVAVAFTIAGGGTLADTTPVSDSSGIASVGAWTLGSPGANGLTATLPGLPVVPFSATATVGAPAQVVVISGNGQSDTAGTTLPSPLVVEVRDSAGNPVPGVTVNWNTLDGMIAPPTSTTAAGGQTQSNWTLSTNRITQTATASVTGLTAAVFTATAVFPNPSILVEIRGGNRVRVGSFDTLDITLTAPAPMNGALVSVVSSNPAVLVVDTALGGGVLIPEGLTTGLVVVEGLAGGSATLTASATGYADGMVTVPVSVQVLAMPGTLNVPFGATASLPLQISAPAPAGGVTVTLSSDAPGLLQVLTPSVIIPEGSQTANATLSGVLPGPANVTGTTVDFGAAVTAATVTASLNIVQTSATLDASFGAIITIRLESGGSPIAAPGPGVPVTLTPADPTCLAPTSPVTIATGLVDTVSALAYGGSATLPCVTQLVASASNIAPDSISVTVNPPPGISVGAGTVGAGLQLGASGSLATSQHGGVNLIIRTLTPDLRIAPDQSTPGADSLVVFLPNGSTFFSYTIQALEGVADTGATSAPVQVSAAGFTTDTVVHVIRPAGYRLGGFPTATTTLSPEDPFVVQVGVMNVPLTAISQFQNLRSGGPGVTASIVLSDSAVGRLVTSADTAGTVTVAIPAGNFQSPSSVGTGGAAFDPQTAGVSTATATIPGLVAESNMTTVTVSAPTIGLNAVTVGAGLQLSASGSLGASQHGGVDVIVKSLLPGVLLISPNLTTAGGDSLVLALANGATFISYGVQALEGVADTGAVSAMVEVRAAGFTPDTVTHIIRPAGYRLAGFPATSTTLTPDDPFVVQVGVMNSALTALSQFQNLRVGSAGVTATIVLSDSSVGQLVTNADTAGTVTVQIPEQMFQSPGTVAAGGAAFDPVTAGATTATVSIPGLVAESNMATVTVTAPVINLSASTVGAGLQLGSSGSLGATQHGGVNVVIKSLLPGALLIAPDQATVGGDSLVVPIADGSTFFGYTIQGLEGVADTGAVSAMVEVRAPGFTTDTVTHIIRPAGYRVAGVTTSTTTLNPDDPFVVQVGVMNAPLTSISQFQNLRAGSAGLTVTLTSSVPGVGQLVTTAVTGSPVTVGIPEQTFQSPSTVATGGVAFDALTTGVTVVAASIPGLVAEANQATVTVTTPGISVGALTVGAGLQQITSASLGASQHGGVNLIIKSSNPGVALVSPNSSTPGTDSIIMPLANGFTTVNFYIQGVEFQTGSVLISARATGFTDGSASSTIAVPALQLSGLATQPTVASADDPFVVAVGIPNGNNTAMAQFQSVRAGAPGPLVATVQTEAGGVGQLVTTATTGTSVTVAIAALNLQSPGTVATGGVAFDPLMPGVTTVFATIPTFIALPAATVIITVNP